MLKKFKEWLIGEVPSGSSAVAANKRLAERVELSESQLLIAEKHLLQVLVASHEHVQDMLTIQAKCYNGKTPWNAAALQHELKRNTRAFYILLKHETLPVAFIGAWLVEGEAHITNVAVIPDYQGMGIATWLIHELERLSILEQMKVLSLEVRVSNEKAKRLYRKLGFVDGQIKRGYYSSNLEDALEMSKPLVRVEQVDAT